MVIFTNMQRRPVAARGLVKRGSVRELWSQLRDGEEKPGERRCNFASFIFGAMVWAMGLSLLALHLVMDGSDERNGMLRHCMAMSEDAIPLCSRPFLSLQNSGLSPPQTNRITSNLPVEGKTLEREKKVILGSSEGRFSRSQRRIYLRPTMPGVNLWCSHRRVVV